MICDYCGIDIGPDDEHTLLGSLRLCLECGAFQKRNRKNKGVII